MRTRETIEQHTEPGYLHDTAVLEVLLDIRDLLANPPIEISGEPTTSQEGV